MFVEVAYVGTRGYDLSIGRRGRPEPEPARSAVHVARIAAQSAGAEPVLRDRQQRRADAADGRPRAAAAAPIRSSPTSSRSTRPARKSRYNALQMTGRKRLSQGLMFEGSYTYAKAEEIGMSHQDSYDLEASWALASYDIKHRFVISYLYELPFGREPAFASGASTLVNALIGGWQFNGITTLQSGTPLSITANNTAGIFGARTQPNNNGNDPRLSGPGRGSAQPLFRHDRLQPAGGVHVRQRADLLAGAAGARRAATSTCRSSRTSRSARDDGAVPRRGAQRVQPRAVLGAEHQRHLDVVRRDHLDERVRVGGQLPPVGQQAIDHDRRSGRGGLSSCAGSRDRRRPTECRRTPRPCSSRTRGPARSSRPCRSTPSPAGRTSRSESASGSDARAAPSRDTRRR